MSVVGFVFLEQRAESVPRAPRVAPCRFREAFQDTGDTDMVASMKAYRDIGFTGPIRPDHVPTLAGEDNSEPGYHMLGRLWATGYIKGLMQAVAHGSK